MLRTFRFLFQKEDSIQADVALCLVIRNHAQTVIGILSPCGRENGKFNFSLFLQLGGEEVEYDTKFQLYLQTKLANPHYSPEIAAQCTLVNFTATESGLEDQLIQRTVALEKPELEAAKAELVANFQLYKIQLHQLEDDLLERLANAPEDILSDIPLIEGLEATKKAVGEINEAVEKGKITEVGIDLARESYRLVAAEGAMLYFQLTQLCLANFMYQYSLDSFLFYFTKAVKVCPPEPDEKKRVLLLRETLALGLGGVAIIAAVIAAVWAVAGVYLGRKYNQSADPQAGVAATAED